MRHRVIVRVSVRPGATEVRAGMRTSFGIVAEQYPSKYSGQRKQVIDFTQNKSLFYSSVNSRYFYSTSAHAILFTSKHFESPVFEMIFGPSHL